MKKVTKVKMLLIMLYALFISVCSISCSDDDDNVLKVDTVAFISQLTDYQNQLETLRDGSQYGNKTGMYPEESRDILELVLIQIKKSIRQIENGEETNPSQEKVDELIQAAKKAMEDFKATVIIEYVSVAAELYVDGQNDGYIDFGASENYSKFGNTGKQVFTVELWVKLKYTSGFGSVVDVFIEDSPGHYRKGWVINNFDNKRLRMSLGMDNWGLLEPGIDFSTTEKWVHFAAVINEKGVDGDVNSEGKPIVVKVYMNGELKDQATGLDGNPYNPNDLGTSMIAFRHMGGNLGMTNDWKLSGYIKHFHLWKSAKSQGEIKKLMNEEIKVTGQEDDLVCGWEFDATVEDDTNIPDLTGKYSAKLLGEYKWIPLE